MNKQEVIRWICDKLTAILQFEVQNDMAEYILSMKSERELDEYCNSLLDIKSPVHRNFLSELKKRHKSINQKVTASGSNTDKNTKSKTKNHKKESTDAADIDKKQKKEIITATDATDTDQIQKNAKSKSKKKKYVNIFSDEGQDCQEVFLKGRHKCNCEASKHGLINNCLKCGRIVCKQEGSGPCVVCGELVCSNDELYILNNYQNSESRKLHKRLTRLTINDTTDNKALEHRNTLLEYDRTSAKRTTVIDDQMDYYSANSGWLSSKQREQLKMKGEERQEKKHGSKKTKKINIDFAGRQVYEAEESDVDNDIDLILDNEEPTTINEHLNNPLIDVNIKFDDNAIQKLERHNVDFNKRNAQLNLGLNRVQDAELMLMTDPGLCLSMHQPYASLLLLNIKSHEGRTWFTHHRGRLWIASTAQKPSEEDIENVETFYKRLKGENLTFPKRYPTGCLLGCINVVDCLSQEEYIAQYPQGEVESPFIFICENPIMMTTHFPIKGQHKIYKLDEKIHYAAQKCLMKEIC